MNEIGAAALLISLALSLYGVMVGFLGAKIPWSGGLWSIERAAFACWSLVTVAMTALISLLIRGDFTNRYVFEESNLSLPIFYKIGGLWAGQAGSLLFWNWILVTYMMAVVFVYRKKFLRKQRLPSRDLEEITAVRGLLPAALSMMFLTHLFFTILNLFVANPFETFMGGIPNDGRGLNPLLQHPAMVIHPPILYMGYVGFLVPFSFAIAALLKRQLGSGAPWLRITRKWTLFAWLFLGTGVLLGAKWAYVELGWGGYWGWDPVENASFMPWLTGTAFLHSVMIQERKGMLQKWNMLLIMASFLLCIFGTFLTRSGIVSSVHAFAQSNIGVYFVSFLSLVLLICFYLFVTRWRDLRSEVRIESVLSRESSFLFNNLILLLAAFAVLWGTLFPVLSEAVQGEKINVGPPFFDAVLVPIGLLLLLLTGIGPLVAWRKTSWAKLRKHFTFPFLVTLGTGIVLFLLGVRDFYAGIAFMLAAFVLATICAEFYRAAAVRRTSKREPWPVALWKITFLNKRRYGGYIVHLAVVCLFVGFAGSAFETEVAQEVKEGERFIIGAYGIRCNKIRTFENATYQTLQVEAIIDKKGRPIEVLTPERRFYFASEQPTTEVAIRSTLKEDLYLVVSGTKSSGKVVLNAYVNPLVAWIWIGGIIYILGTMITILPDRRREQKMDKDLTRRGKK
ncbi:MAG: heme lyase CcmF/NrfE family subunit [Deltaproteobacteria bacterium]|nr:heme lyase CcmF/NrfE family subunit [Deltaproteobacteria bacterium]